jgi:hypothetical protein
MNPANAPPNGNLNWWSMRLVSVCIIIAGAYYALCFPWGSWPPYKDSLPWHGAQEWHEWNIDPAKGAEKNVPVLTAGILGIVSLTLRTPVLTHGLRWTYAVAIVFLCAFYLIFVKVAENAIALNHRDLTGIQIGLKLSEEGEYIQGERFYDHRDEKQKEGKGEAFLRQLVPFGICLAIAAVLVVFFLPIPPQNAVPVQHVGAR